MLYINYNGKILEDNSSIIGANNRGLRFGDGLFETMKFKNNQLILADEHFARLWNGMKLLQFDIPKLFNPDFLEQQVISLLKKNKHSSARIRITIIRGNGGLFDAENHHPNFIIQTWPLSDSNGFLNENGLQCCFYHEAKKSADQFSGLKHNNYLPYFMGAIFAQKNKCNDALIFNQRNQICDTTIANIFLINDDTIYTPPLDEGPVAGIMRHHIIQTLNKTSLYNISEIPITQQMVLEANEVFMSNSIYNIRWVAGIENKIYTSAHTRKIFNLLQQTNPEVFC